MAADMPTPTAHKPEAIPTRLLFGANTYGASSASLKANDWLSNAHGCCLPRPMFCSFRAYLSLVP